MSSKRPLSKRQAAQRKADRKASDQEFLRHELKWHLIGLAIVVTFGICLWIF